MLSNPPSIKTPREQCLLSHSQWPLLSHFLLLDFLISPPHFLLSSIFPFFCLLALALQTFPLKLYSHPLFCSYSLVLWLSSPPSLPLPLSYPPSLPPSAPPSLRSPVFSSNLWFSPSFLDPLFLHLFVSLTFVWIWSMGLAGEGWVEFWGFGISLLLMSSASPFFFFPVFFSFLPYLFGLSLFL